MKDFTRDINDYYAREVEAIQGLDKSELNRVANCLLAHYEKETMIYVFGNGGSSATASHMVCDFNKGVCYKLKKKFHFECLNDNIPTLMAVANDVGFDDIFYYPLQGKLKKEDLVIAISGSGNSHNVIKAVTYAKSLGCEIIGMTGYDGGKLDKLSDYHLHAAVNDMQIVEDIHMSYNHMLMQILWRYLMEKDGQRAIYKINQ